MSLFGNKDFEAVLDHLMLNEPMRWQGLMMEKALLSDDFPEFEFLDDDMMVLDMQHELLAALN